jgi:hypothetical protein
MHSFHGRTCDYIPQCLTGCFTQLQFAVSNLESFFWFHWGEPILTITPQEMEGRDNHKRKDSPIFLKHGDSNSFVNNAR